jgi:hypothetical protein
MPYRYFHFSSRATSEAGKPQGANECTLVGEVNVYVFYENECKGHAFTIFHSEKLRIVREAEEIGNHAAG